MSAQRTLLSGNRWHYQHGPIDIILCAEGDGKVIAFAHDALWNRFPTILSELVEELTLLHSSPCTKAINPLSSFTGRLMWDACAPFSDRFITSMAAVAGAVAQTLLPFFDHERINKVWINNGGDIAFRLQDDAQLRIGAMNNSQPTWHTPTPSIDLLFTADDAVAGVATSGCGGRSFSLGIADSVTVVARTAAMADAAATMIANAVNVDDARIVRRPASELKDHSDLGDRLVTVQVPELPRDLIAIALQNGITEASAFLARDLIAGAVLQLQGQTKMIGLQQIANDKDARGSTNRLSFALSARTATDNIVQERSHETALEYAA